MLGFTWGGNQDICRLIFHSFHNSNIMVDVAMLFRKSPMTNNGMAGGHHRAHSSPATLEQTYSVAASQSPLGHQPSAQSLQSGSSGNLSEDPLPPGWEQACTAEGQLYFIK